MPLVWMRHLGREKEVHVPAKCKSSGQEYDCFLKASNFNLLILKEEKSSIHSVNCCHGDGHDLQDTWC